MTDACFNISSDSGNMQFDPTGNFLFVQDAVLNRIRVLQVEAGQKVLRDTGSAIPFTGSLFFSPNGALVFAVSSADRQVHLFSFDKSSGALTPKGSPTSFSIPFLLVSSTRN